MSGRSDIKIKKLLKLFPESTNYIRQLTDFVQSNNSSHRVVFSARQQFKTGKGGDKYKICSTGQKHLILMVNLAAISL